MPEQPQELNPSAPVATTGIRSRRARISLAAPGRGRIPAALVPVLWGAVFLAGGLAVLSAVPRSRDRLAALWKASSEPAAAAREMISEVHAATVGGDALLKLEWPSHPDARGYRIRFRDAEGHALAPVTVEQSVFLYDLKSDVLGLPDSFEWEVSAVLGDGTEVVAPPQVHSTR